MAEIVNLRERRKREARRQAESRAAENCARFGRTKAEKLKASLEAARARRNLEQKRLEREGE